MKDFNILKRFLGLKIQIESEDDFNEIHSEISEGVRMSGSNAWILGVAMIIACIGLTTNSISAVIGAMLISPLMGPIVGFSFGLATNDQKLRQKGIKNWIVMTLVSLISATVYFLINPFDNSTEMLESFKKASIFDILIAFFGGIVGFIGILKKEGTKIIAGVAVATACMPPLCTSAYGLAHLDYKYFIGGLYFYLINCLFIDSATFLLTRYLKINHQSRSQLSRKSLIMWDILVVIMLLPGVYIAYNKWKIEENKPKTLTDKQRIESLERRIEQLEATYTK